MIEITIRWTFKIIAFLLVGPLIGLLLASLEAPDGGSGVSLLINGSPASAIIRVLIAIILAGVIGVVTAKFTTYRLGLFCMGVALAWAAWDMGRLPEIVRHTPESSILIKLAIETAVVGVATLGMAFVVLRVGKADAVDHAGPLFESRTLPALGSVILAGAIASFLMARSPLVGQTFAAAALAGLVGVTFARVVAHGTPMLVLLAGLFVLGVLGHVVAFFLAGPDFRATVYAGDVFALARVMPLDWASGMLVGAPVGATWAASFTEQHVEKTGEPSSARQATTTTTTT